MISFRDRALHEAGHLVGAFEAVLTLQLPITYIDQIWISTLYENEEEPHGTMLGQFSWWAPMKPNVPCRDLSQSRAMYQIALSCLTGPAATWKLYGRNEATKMLTLADEEEAFDCLTSAVAYLTMSDPPTTERLSNLPPAFLPLYLEHLIKSTFEKTCRRAVQLVEHRWNVVVAVTDAVLATETKNDRKSLSRRPLLKLLMDNW
jgi:hypothetical protein